MKFCAKTKGLNEDQNKEFAKDLKAFTKKEAEKFRNEKQSNEEAEEEE